MKSEKMSRFFEKFKLSKTVKRNITVVCSLLLIGCAIALNWVFFTGEDPDDNAVQDISAEENNSLDSIGDVSFVGASDEENGYFSTIQVNRQRARDEAMETLLMVVDSDSALQEAKDEAYESINRIAANIENEANVETLIMAKGFEECVAVISDNSASVIVKSQGLLPNEVAQIQEIVCEHSGLSAKDITIIETN